MLSDDDLIEIQLEIETQHAWVNSQVEKLTGRLQILSGIRKTLAIRLRQNFNKIEDRGLEEKLISSRKQKNGENGS